MKYLFVSLLVLLQFAASAQFADDLIAKIHKAQNSINAISYTLLRTDTFVTGQTRIIHGHAKMKTIANDTIFGFAFWGKRDDVNSFTVYDGKMGYDVDEKTKLYRTSSGTMIPHMLGAPGGQIVFQELVKLDTAGATRFEVKEDSKFYYLTVFYPDLKEYDVERRYKFLTIDKKLMIPVVMRKYQETLGKVQHLKYEASEIKMNGNAVGYDFSSQAFFETYNQEVSAPPKALAGLKDKLAPEFSLVSFSGEKVATAALAGKVVLLDFWEVWCGPCVASMPKVGALYEKYRSRGLQVYGVTNEPNNLESSKKLVSKRNVKFPMLVGNKEIENNYKVRAIPLYVLIDKKGFVCFVSEGFSDKMEEAIKKALE